jgi:hypothetical protein
LALYSSLLLNDLTAGFTSEHSTGPKVLSCRYPVFLLCPQASVSNWKKKLPTAAWHSSEVTQVSNMAWWDWSPPRWP